MEDELDATFNQIYPLFIHGLNKTHLSSQTTFKEKK